MTDNTNDPVGVLISALEKLAAQDSGIVASSAKSDCMAATAKAALRNYKAAAIQHSEQRETVPAAAVLSISWPMPRYRMETGYMQPDERGSWCKWIDVHPNMDSPPVAAPVPEAKAEQVTDANEICQLPPDGWYCTRKAGHDGPCAAHEHGPDRELDSYDYACIAQGMERLKASEHTMVVKVERNRVWIVRGVQSFMLAYEADTQQELEWYAAKLSGALSIFTPGVKSATPAAPAVKHEASELPVPVTCQIYGHVVGHCGECNLGADDDINATNAVLADNYRKLTLAPPIAVQGSIADDAELDDICRAFHEAWSHDDRQAAENRLRTYIDSRSPVAAAPGLRFDSPIIKFLTGEEAYDGVWFGARHPDRKGVFWWRAELIAALSAAAPSADAKGDDRG